MNKEYWNEFYRNSSRQKNNLECSGFAEFCNKQYLKKSKFIIELGCGDGKDAFYFAQNGHSILAVDQSVNSIKPMPHANLEYLDADFTNLNKQKVDVFYSRFSMHAITQEDEKKLLPRTYKSLNKGGLFCIEARTINDSIE